MTSARHPGAALPAAIAAVAALVLAAVSAGATSAPEPWRPPTGGAAKAPAAAPAFTDTLPRADHAYRFEDYAVDAWASKPVAADLTSHARAADVKTLLRGVPRMGPNFAGPYTIITGGCGAGCLHFVLADARTGQVWIPDFRARVGYEFRKDSRLLVLDPPSYIASAQRVSPQIGPLWTRYYVWTGAGFAAVDSVRVDPPAAKGKG